MAAAAAAACLGGGNWGDFTGDGALGMLPGLAVGALEAVGAAEPEDAWGVGPIFAGGWSSGVPLAYINLLIKLSWEEREAGGVWRSGNGVPLA